MIASYRQLDDNEYALLLGRVVIGQIHVSKTQLPGKDGEPEEQEVFAFTPEHKWKEIKPQAARSMEQLLAVVEAEARPYVNGQEEEFRRVPTDDLDQIRETYSREDEEGDAFLHTIEDDPETTVDRELVEATAEEEAEEEDDPEHGKSATSQDLQQQDEIHEIETSARQAGFLAESPQALEEGLKQRQAHEEDRSMHEGSGKSVTSQDLQENESIDVSELVDEEEQCERDIDSTKLDRVLSSGNKSELVEEAESRGLKVTRKEGEGEPTKEDYARALTRDNKKRAKSE